MPVGWWRTGVYSICNKVNGKRYVGSAARSLRAREKDHWYRLRTSTHANAILQRAWDKYGEAAFEFVVVERCPPNECLVREQRWIDYYDSANGLVGYNICAKAGSRLGTILSAEVRARFSKTAKEAMNRPEVRAKLSEATKRVMSCPRARGVLSKAAKRRFQNPEARALASEAAKKCQARPEVKAKKAATLALPEVKERISESLKKSWRDNPNRNVYRPDWGDAEYRRLQSALMVEGHEKNIISKGKEIRDKCPREFTIPQVMTALGYTSKVGARVLVNRLIGLGQVRVAYKRRRKLTRYIWSK